MIGCMRSVALTSISLAMSQRLASCGDDDDSMRGDPLKRRGGQKEGRFVRLVAGKIARGFAGEVLISSFGNVERRGRGVGNANGPWGGVHGWPSSGACRAAVFVKFPTSREEPDRINEI